MSALDSNDDERALRLAEPASGFTPDNSKAQMDERLNP
jgi:hypothetical protein